MGNPVRSLAARLLLMVAAFAAVPVFLYDEFSRAEQSRRQVLLSRLQIDAQLIAGGLALGLAPLKLPTVTDTRKVLDQLAPQGVTVRLLFRPRLPDGRMGTVFLVGAAPPLDPANVEDERHRLADAGVIRAVPDTCTGSAPLDQHYSSASGAEEVLISMVPFATPSGCWGVVTALSAGDPAGALLDRPYWKSREIHWAAAVYAVLALLVLSLSAALWLNLRRFGREARRVADGQPASSPFARVNKIPELDGVAGELDRMVGNLQATAQAFRFAAEENAHAFKTPIATIAQSLEPLRRLATQSDSAARPIQVIEASLNRLDALVAASRRLDQINADLVSPPRQTVDLSRLTDDLVQSYDDVAETRHVGISRRIQTGCRVLGGIEMMETVIENILDNALSFSPPGSRISVSLTHIFHGPVVLEIADQGPGVPPDMLDRMFDRYVSNRPGQDVSQVGEAHFGIGLWIVRRNLTAVGGSVTATNRPEGGLVMTVTLPGL